MDKIKTKPIEAVKNAIIVILTLTMLVLAAIYIGGSQFMRNNAAINTSNLPSGAIKVGDEKSEDLALYEEDWLAILFSGVHYDDKCVGAYTDSHESQALSQFAKSMVHQMLGADSHLISGTKQDFVAAQAENFIYLALPTPLPYQTIYALCGEYDSPASSTHAVNADRMLITFDIYGNAKLYLSDGENFYTATKAASLSLSEVAAIAGDSRLKNFSLTENGVPLCDESYAVSKLSLSTEKILTLEQKSAILERLGYNPESVAELHGTEIHAVSPLGTLNIDSEMISYTAALDNGIPISNFLQISPKDSGVRAYDILLACVSLVQSLREISPNVFASTVSPYIDSLYSDGGEYTVIIGIAEKGLPIKSDVFPYFAKITVIGNRFKTVEIKSLSVQKSGSVGMTFPSGWSYNYVLENADIKNFSLIYSPTSFNTEEISASWHYTRIGGDKK